MENASKAVLIAGGVLVALAVLSISLMIYHAATKALGSTEIQIDTILVQEYNSAYLAYDKEYVTGIEVKQCISEVLYSNANSADPTIFATGLTVQNATETYEYIKMQVDAKGKKKATNNNLSLANIKNSSRYTVSFVFAKGRKSPFYIHLYLL